MKVLALVALVACGSPHHGIDAAGGGDDGPAGHDGSNGLMVDAPPIDVPYVRGTVKVTITNATVALCSLAQLHVVFIDVDSTVTDLVADASGKAQADVFPGASVTAVCERTTGTTDIAVTVQDVEPGDDITLDGAYFLNGARTADTTAAGTFKISYPAASGATTYTVYYPCGNVSSSQTSNVALAMKAGCVLSAMDLVVVAGNNSGPTAWAEAPNVPFANNGSVTVTDTWHPLAQNTASYSAAPSFCGDAQSPDYPCDVQLARYVPELHGFHPMTQMTAISSSAMITTTSPDSSTAIMQSRVENAAGVAYQVITDVVDGSAATYTVNVATRLLPWMCLGTAQCPQFSDVDAKLTIPLTGAGLYDLFEADANYTRGQQIFIWRVFGPTAGDVTFPVLPASVAVVRPQAGDHQSVTHSRICESDVLNGWRDARQNPFDALATCTQSTNPTSPRYGGSHNRLSASQ